MTLTVTLPVSGADIPYSRLTLRLLAPLPFQQTLAHLVLGLTGEAGEYADAIKKHIIYGKELDTTNVLEELGDILFYLQAATNVHGYSLEEVAQANCNKLGRIANGDPNYADSWIDLAGYSTLVAKELNGELV